MLSFSFLACRIGAIFSRFLGEHEADEERETRAIGKSCLALDVCLVLAWKTRKKKRLFCKLSFTHGLYQLGRNIYGQWWRSWTLRNEVDLWLETERS